ncbi:hypothetical protein Patl1_19586 [Pistacia atlantica]|uniref:Uncharacterized protein n=1 Tax=Pistacia atlantica TaxID=434234 RepID=A0ACC1C272_9ROSI|nr:hypothetical protein Patl1_19586 [Pistacia atlantica]
MVCLKLQKRLAARVLSSVVTGECGIILMRPITSPYLFPVSWLVKDGLIVKKPSTIHSRSTTKL